MASQKMKVIGIKEDVLRFDNGLYIKSFHYQDCCETNYLDFEQFHLGDEFPVAKTLGELVDQMRIKKDGFSLVDAQGIPKWVQARSCQNGYYSNRVGLTIGDGKIELKLQDPKSVYDEYFEGSEAE